MADGTGALIAAILALTQGKSSFGPVLEGIIYRAGDNKLVIDVGQQRLEKEDIRLDPYYCYTWTEDNGDPSYLRKGDHVLLLTPDAQTYYLICKVVACT